MAAGMRRGAIAMAPILVGIVPFGLIAGAVSIDAGIGLAGAVAFSLGVFAGASQIVSINLLGEGAHAAVAIFAGAVVNLRMLMYSASMAPELAAIPLRWRLGASYVLTDQSFAVAVTDWTDRADHHDGLSERFGVFVGAGVALWSTWQVSTVIGAVGGQLVPESIPLTFAVPLAFLSLLVPLLRDRPAIVAAIVGGVVATLADGLPHGLGLPLGAVAGVASGVIASRRLPTDPGANEPVVDGGHQ